MSCKRCLANQKTFLIVSCGCCCCCFHCCCCCCCSTAIVIVVVVVVSCMHQEKTRAVDDMTRNRPTLMIRTFANMRTHARTHAHACIFIRLWLCFDERFIERKKQQDTRKTLLLDKRAQLRGEALSGASHSDGWRATLHPTNAAAAAATAAAAVARNKQLARQRHVAVALRANHRQLDDGGVNPRATTHTALRHAHLFWRVKEADSFGTRFADHAINCRLRQIGSGQTRQHQRFSWSNVETQNRTHTHIQ